jgi:plastocyanin
MRCLTWALTLAAALSVVSLVAGDQADPKTHTVTIEGMRFQPDVVTVSRGDTIVWINKDLVPHTATSKAGRFDSKTIPPDDSWKHVVGAQGDFTYICTFHPTMKGTLRVR